MIKYVLLISEICYNIPGPKRYLVKVGLFICQRNDKKFLANRD